EHIVKRKYFLNSCLVGSFVKWVGSPEAIRNWAAEEWGVDERIKITQLNDTWVLFRFVSKDQVMKILKEGRRWFNNNFMHLKRWKENVGCVDSRFSGNTRILARHVYGENLGEKRREGPCFNYGGRWGCQEEMEINLEYNRRGRGFGGGRRRRKDLRDSVRLESTAGFADAASKKRGEGAFEFWKGRENPRKEKRHFYPWISELGWRDKLNRFNNPNGENHKESKGSGSFQKNRRFPGQSQNVNDMANQTHPRRSYLERKSRDCHGNVQRLFRPENRCWEAGSLGDTALEGIRVVNVVEAAPAPEMGLGVARKDQSLPLIFDSSGSSGGSVRGSSSNSKYDAPIGVGAVSQDLQQFNNIDSCYDVIHEIDTRHLTCVEYGKGSSPEIVVAPFTYLLDGSRGRRKRSPFRFKNMWLKVADFGDKVGWRRNFIEPVEVKGVVHAGEEEVEGAIVDFYKCLFIEEAEWRYCAQVNMISTDSLHNLKEDPAQFFMIKVVSRVPLYLDEIGRLEKIDEGAEFVEANIQSSIAGIAPGGTCRKLLRSESTIGSVEFIGVAIGEANSGEGNK
ncbi:hypothetical protein HAX54_010846, partial [Datura stramonium]|nr:hypothetical protein [Datura stramonium]